MSNAIQEQRKKEFKRLEDGTIEIIMIFFVQWNNRKIKHGSQKILAGEKEGYDIPIFLFSHLFFTTQACQTD